MGIRHTMQFHLDASGRSCYHTLNIKDFPSCFTKHQVYIHCPCLCFTYISRDNLNRFIRCDCNLICYFNYLVRFCDLYRNDYRSTRNRWDKGSVKRFYILYNPQFQQYGSNHIIDIEQAEESIPFCYGRGMCSIVADLSHEMNCHHDPFITNELLERFTVHKFIK